MNIICNKMEQNNMYNTYWLYNMYTTHAQFVNLKKYFSVQNKKSDKAKEKSK